MVEFEFYKIIIVQDRFNFFTQLIREMKNENNFRDHAGGNKQLKEMMPNLLVYGGDERIDCLTKKVSHDDQLKIGSLGVKCLFTPCHTTGHICYYVTSKNESGTESKAVFTGDLI